MNESLVIWTNAIDICSNVRDSFEIFSMASYCTDFPEMTDSMFAYNMPPFTYNTFCFLPSYLTHAPKSYTVHQTEDTALFRAW